MTHTHTHTHTWKPTHWAHVWSYVLTHTHTRTHIDIGIGTMGLPSLQAMGVGGGGFPCFARLLWEGGLESCWGRGAVRGVGGCSFLSFTGGLFYALKI